MNNLEEFLFLILEAQEKMKKRIDKSKIRRSFGKDRILYIQKIWVRLMRKTNEFQVPLFNSIKKALFLWMFLVLKNSKLA